MKDHGPGEVIDEAFFGWSLTAGEHTIISCSLSPELAEMWRARLQDHVRLQPVPGFPTPQSALSYLEFSDGSAAVLRRVRQGYTEGRENTHVLIGSQTALGASLALRLEHWDGWKSTAPHGGMGTTAAPYLASVAGSEDELLTRARPLEMQLVEALVRLLEYPGRPLSIVGCPDHYRVPMAWALHRAAKRHLEQTFNQGRRWTFSTYQERHGAGIDNLPEVVFLPAMPSDGEQHNRTVVRLDELVATNSQFTDIARQLVAGLFHGAQQQASPPRQPVNRVHPAPVDVPSGGVRLQPSAVAVSTPSPMRTASNTADALSGPLLGAQTADAFLTALRTLAADKDRGPLRSVMNVDEVNRAVEFVEINTRFEMLTRLLEVLYGPDCQDLKGPDEALAHAARLVENCRSDQLALMLGRAAAKHKRPTVYERVLERELHLGGPLKPGPRNRVKGVLSWVGKRRQRFALVAVAAFLLLVAGLIGGYLLGQPETVAAPATPVPSTAAPTTTTDPPVSQLKSGTVQVAADVRTQQVFAFVQVGDRYFPQGACAALDIGSSTWSCEQSYTPAVSAGADPALVAVVVQAGQVEGLLGLAAQRKGVPWTTGWSSQVPVKSG
ncbi:hypothetical protein ACSHWB_26760 [Lentzea sp. HUAS TT2]|uniref:hypothetical protein n=1 Tax=Lentzea sp. HUAS TT2 TaxID=3447454 RepID=UPI003F6EDE43